MEAEYRQRVIAASLGPDNPNLYFDLFDDQEVAEEAGIYYADGDMVDDSGVFQPRSDEDFDKMLEMMDQLDAIDNPHPVGIQPFPEVPAALNVNPLPIDDAAALAAERGFALPEQEED